MEIKEILQQEFQLKEWQIDHTLQLIAEGNTIPFIARYRKEMTGSLSDEVLRELSERLTYLENLFERREKILQSIEEQGKLTPELKDKINKANTMVVLEDLYRPYKQKRRTRATIAKEKGLGPLAELIMKQDAKGDFESLAQSYLSEEKELISIELIWQGVRDILSEAISDEARFRKYLRQELFYEGLMQTKGREKELEVYEMYEDYSEPVKRIANHRILAINRGEKEKKLSVKLVLDEARPISYMKKVLLRQPSKPYAKLIEEAIEDAYKRLIFPAVEREIRNELTERAQEDAIQVFGKNLEQLLLQPPIVGNRVLAIDPAFRTGCKIAAIDQYGKVLDTGVIYPTAPHNKIHEASAKLIEWIKAYDLSLIAIGNGTASRETEQFTVDVIKQYGKKIHYVIVNEAGASVYSASKLGTEEFPEYDVALRSAVSIGRRLQDPLAELVKIDPKAIGVGQYQHDMNQAKLDTMLSGVVEKTVNQVGVDLNTSSVSLLEHVSGLTKNTAKNIVSYREENGAFTRRKQLLKVKKLGPKTYEQCAGFLRIRHGENLFDNTGVHPESYKAAEELMQEIKDYRSTNNNQKLGKEALKSISEKIGIGLPTCLDILKELEKPGRDPRDQMPKPVLREDILEMKDLHKGMRLKGTVRNIVDFGAFVDIGVHQDGLVHISQMSNKFIKHPLDVVAIGDIVEVEVLDVEEKKKRISLTMCLE